MQNYEEEWSQLLGAIPQNQLAQGTPPITQGLLGSSGEQAKQLQNLISKGTQAANQMAQVAPMQTANNSDVAQRQAMTQQMAQQAMQQQAQKQAQAGSLLGTIASMFIPSGSILNYFKGVKG